MRWLLRMVGYKIAYVCDWGEYPSRYDSTDYMMGRPIHKNMSVAPPWAKAKLRKAGLLHAEQPEAPK